MLRFALLLPLLALFQCQGDESVAAYGAAKTRWMLESINGERVGAPSSLTFPEPGKIAGQAPCNSYHATLDAPYPWFELRDLVATSASCALLEAEGTFFAALLAMTQSEVSGNVLILRSDSGAEMVFKAAE